MNGDNAHDDFTIADGASDDDAGYARLKKAPSAFRTISEVADELLVPQHVLRFWETRFSEVKPLKRGGGRRYYRPDDVELLRRIAHLLYVDGYTIKGVQRVLREGTELASSEKGGSEAIAPLETPGIAINAADNTEDLFSISHGVTDDTPLSRYGDEQPLGHEASPPDVIEIVGQDSSDFVAEFAQTDPIMNDDAPDISDDRIAEPAAQNSMPDALDMAESPGNGFVAAEHARITRENALLRHSLNGILIELQAIRRLIPV